MLRIINSTKSNCLVYEKKLKLKLIHFFFILLIYQCVMKKIKNFNLVRRVKIKTGKSITLILIQEIFSTTA